MAFNIENFKAVVSENGGLLKPSKFRVRFNLPEILGNRNMSRHMESLAEQVNVPGITFSTHDVRRYGYGPIEKRPIGHNFTDLNVTFISDGNGDIHRLMHQWLSQISPYDMRDGITGRNGTNTPFLLNYKDLYKTDLEIFVYNEGAEDADDPAILLRVREAFPMAMNDSQFNWGEYNNIARFSVQFAFMDWHLDRTQFTKLSR